jgi:hypothetical protein
MLWAYAINASVFKTDHGKGVPPAAVVIPAAIALSGKGLGDG